MERAQKDFQDADGGWFLSEPDPALPARPCGAIDGPTPAAVATLAVESARLYALTGDARHRTRAEKILGRYAGDVRKHPFAHATLLSAVLLLERPIQIVIRGERGSAEFENLLDVVARTPIPSRVLTVVDNGHAPAAGHPLGRYDRPAASPLAHVCVGATCLAPAASPADLAVRLEDARRLACRGPEDRKGS